MMSLGQAPPWTFDGICRPVADRAVRALLADRDDGYPKTTHRLRFPREAGFLSGPVDQAGDVFGRAVVADALADARDVGLWDPGDGLVAEAQYLAGRRQRTYPWAWCYFPDLPELGPDADDLAQVGQVLLRSLGPTAAAEHLERAVGVALANMRQSGALRTWLGQPSDTEPGRPLQEEWVRRAWGDTDDSEVAANLLYLLALWDDDRFAEELQLGAAHLATTQSADGCWFSTWYTGPYYGTYVCCRALALTARGVEPLDRALTFLLDRQQPDGRWAADGRAEQLSSALALCTLAAIAERIPLQPGVHSSVFAGLAALDESTGGGAWSADPIIKMRQSLVDDGHPLLYFGSETLTAAFALKAAAAWSSPAMRGRP
jgi:squalene-hopene/tetraprenyl-beta-curcumene cyclase